MRLSARHLSAMRVFVTGLGGYLGSAIGALAPDATGIVGRYKSALTPFVTAADVRDAASVASALNAARPDAVIHTAYVQDGPEARSVNVEGSRVIARASHDRGLRLVHLSTDVVFSGRLGRPIREDDPVDPVTDYGRTKADAETAVVAAHPDAVVVRTSLIYGGAEPSRHEQLALDPSMTFYEDEIRCPVAAPDLAAAVLELAARPEITGPLHVAGADAVSRLDFARLVAGTGVNGAPRPAARPGDLRLDSSKANGLLATRLRGVREVLA
jgi:dTDP-4-dehydrorhamnose reductase